MFDVHGVGDHFPPSELTSTCQILNYLRDTAEAIEVHLPVGTSDLQALLREAQFYRLNDLRHRIAEVLVFVLMC